MMSVIGTQAGVNNQLKNKDKAGNWREALAQLDLRPHQVWRANGDNRWRLIICRRGVVWITQKGDLQDYVLKEGDMFLITLRGEILIQALEGARIEVTPSLKATPYRGDYTFFA
jgi:hypothetical protein